MACYAAKFSKFYELEVSVPKAAAFRSRVCGFRPSVTDVGIINGSGVFRRSRFAFYEEIHIKKRVFGASGSGRRCFSCFLGFYQGRQKVLVPQKSMVPASFPCNLFLFLPTNIRELASTRRDYNEIVSGISCDEEDMRKDLKLLLLGESGEVNPSKETCGLYIKKLCGSGRVSDAACLLLRLHDRRIQLTLDTYNVVLAAAGEMSNFELFCIVFQKLLLSRLSPDATSYANVAKAVLNLPASSLLIEFIRGVSEITSSRDPTVVNRILFSTAKSGQIDKSLMMFEELKNLQCKIDVVTFNTILAMLGRAGLVERMLAEFSSMKELGHSPDMVTYNTLINCFRRLGRFDLCKVCAREALERGFQLDLQAYTALVDVAGRAGHVSDAMTLFSEMKRFHRPSVYVYRALIGGLKKHGKIGMAQDLLEEMKSSSSKLIGPENFRRRGRTDQS